MVNTEPQETQPSISPKSNKVLVALLLVFTLLIGGVIGYFSYPQINNWKQASNIASKTTTIAQNKETAAPTPTKAKTEEAPFCKEYGTYQVNKNDLFEQYIVGPGETLRDIAKKKLNDERKATDFITVNPQLSAYEIDDELPIGIKIYIPVEKYNVEGVVAYLKVKGNIIFNKDKPMFGVSSPNSTTGTFIISDNIKRDLKNILDGDCVTVVYGSRSIGSEFVIFEVKPQ